MGATTRTGIISLIYRFRLQKFRLESLHYNTQESYPKILDAIIGENQSVVIKNRTIIHIRDEIDVS